MIVIVHKQNISPLVILQGILNINSAAFPSRQIIITLNLHMLESFILFLTINAILLTVELTVSRGVILFLLGVVVMRFFKWWRQGQGNDKIVLEPLPNQIGRLVIVDMLAAFLSVLLHPQPVKKYLIYVVTTGVLIAAGRFFSSLTIFIAFFNLMVIMQIRRGFQQPSGQKLRTRLGIRHTNSILTTPSSPPKKQVATGLE